MAIDRLRIKAGPEEREVANVAVVFAPHPAAGRQMLGFDHHLGEFGDRFARLVPQAIDRVEMNEAGEEGGKVIGQRRVGHAEVGEEGVFRQPREHPSKRMPVGRVPHDWILMFLVTSSRGTAPPHVI